jgi:hypothetical protein
MKKRRRVMIKRRKNGAAAHVTHVEVRRATLPTYNPKPLIRLVRCSGGKLRHHRHHSVAVMETASQVNPDGTAPLLLPLHSFPISSISSMR